MTSLATEPGRAFSELLIFYADTEPRQPAILALGTVQVCIAKCLKMTGLGQ